MILYHQLTWILLQVQTLKNSSFAAEFYSLINLVLTPNAMYHESLLMICWLLDKQRIIYKYLFVANILYFKFSNFSMSNLFMLNNYFEIHPHMHYTHFWGPNNKVFTVNVSPFIITTAADFWLVDQPCFSAEMRRKRWILDCLLAPKRKTNKAWRTTMINGPFHAPSHLLLLQLLQKENEKAEKRTVQLLLIV